MEVRASPTMSGNLWECIAPTLHIAINSNVNGLVLSIMDGIDTQRVGLWDSVAHYSRSKKKVGSPSKKDMSPSLTVVR